MQRLKSKTTGLHPAHPDGDVVEVIERTRASNAFIENPEGVSVKECCLQEHEAEVAQATLEVTEQDAGSSPHEVKNLMPREERTTLSAALEGHQNLDSALPDLFRLLYFLRSAPGEGADEDILPNPMMTRTRVKTQKTKWQNVASHMIALLDADSKQPAIRQSRQQAWAQQVEAKRQDEFSTLPSNLTIDMGDLIAAKVDGKWIPCMVLSIWRNFKGGSGGGQLVARELARGSLLALRAVCLLAALDWRGPAGWNRTIMDAVSDDCKYLMTVNECKWM